MNPELLVGVGGVVGALGRHALGEWTETELVDTLAVNLLGSFLLGALVATPVGHSLLLFLGTGFCGAFTTFSSFAVETVRLGEDDETGRAVLNATGTLAGALAAVSLGAVAAGMSL